MAYCSTRLHQKLRTNTQIQKVVGYKINIQRSVVSQYTNNDLSERKIKKTIPLITVSKRIQCLGINFAKEPYTLKALYTEN